MQIGLLELDFLHLPGVHFGEPYGNCKRCLLYHQHADCRLPRGRWWEVQAWPLDLLMCLMYSSRARALHHNHQVIILRLISLRFGLEGLPEKCAWSCGFGSGVRGQFCTWDFSIRFELLIVLFGWETFALCLEFVFEFFRLIYLTLSLICFYLLFC